MIKIILSVIVIIFIFISLNYPEPAHTALFIKLDPGRCGVNFENTLNENSKENMLTFTNFYTGSGVGIIDINNDKLQDIFFGGNQVTSRLYLNKGNLTFEDITEKAGIVTDRWVTGVSIVDINQDGLDDIYLSVSGFLPDRKKGNMLFVNHGNNTFSEKSAEYNLNEKEQTTHTSFFDYDRDGDLDAFMATNPTDFPLNSTDFLHKPLVNGESRGTDKLYRNEGNGKFTDVSREAGILIEGYSLGVNSSDFNHDGWIDILVTNDYITNDILYINNHDGTFSDQSGSYFSYTSFASMGNDAGDINNDGLLDIISLDMLPESSYREKTHVLPASYKSFGYTRSLGYEPQFSRNGLQLNNGNNTFSEIGQLAGIDRTDWSWAALLTELDNDGDKDLFVTTGFRRDMGYLDYVFYNERSPFKMARDEITISSQLKSIKTQDGLALVNYAFKNNNDLTFTNTSEEWGFEEETYSNGLAVADLDNDGDNDIIINNIDQLASIYENQSDSLLACHYLKLSLRGTSKNQSALGAKITIYYKGNLQYIENNLYRGYMSTVEKNIIFGTGNFTFIDSVKVLWPDGLWTIRYHVPVDTTLVLECPSTGNKNSASSEMPDNPVKFFDISAKLGIKYKHSEDNYVDFYDQPLLAQQHSQLGPSIAVGDINGDGMEDFFIGGASGFHATIFFQNEDGTFRSEEFPFDNEFEDMGALLFDFDRDSDLDLYVVSGGTSVKLNSNLYQDRLYLNNGKGRFNIIQGLLPVINSSGGVVIAADFDGDNDLDLFRGGRFSPMSYPLTPRSYLLENRGGRFIDVTKEIAPGLESAGMVTSALWTDCTGDRKMDLVIAGEWMPVTVFEYSEGHFTDRTRDLGLENTRGWWNSISGGDFDNDGITDYLLGNLGSNHGYHVSVANPLKMVAKDFDNNGVIDPIISMKYTDGYYPVVSRKDFLNAFVNKLTTYSTYEKYAVTTSEDLLANLGTEGAIVLEANIMENCLLTRKANSGLQLNPIPNLGQLSPIYGSLASDINGDGKTDFLFVGNFYNNNVAQGPYSASTGGQLSPDHDQGMLVIRGQENGFYVHTNARAIAGLILANNKKIYLVTSNDDSLKVFSEATQTEEQIKLGPFDSFAEIEFYNGLKRKQEFYYGSGYLSQSSRFLSMSAGWKKVRIFTYSGKERVITYEDYSKKK